MLLQFPLFSLSPPPPSPTVSPPQASPYIVVCVHGLCINVLWCIVQFKLNKCLCIKIIYVYIHTCTYIFRAEVLFPVLP